MPRLLAFVACEKIIISDQNSASVIGILQGFELPSAPPADQTVALPLQWGVFTLWEKEDSDGPFQFVQKIEMVATDGTSLLPVPAETPLIDPIDVDKRFQRVMLHMTGFPVRGGSDQSLRLLLRTGDGDFVEKARFTIPISIHPA